METMKATIEVEMRDTGNARRGYHDTTTTIKFSYAGENSPTWVPEKQRKIVDAIVWPRVELDVAKG